VLLNQPQLGKELRACPGRTGFDEREIAVLSPEFNIVVGLAGDDAVEVSVSGDLDADSLSRLRVVLNGILRAGHRRVVVDLARSGSVDGNAREMLARVLKRAKDQGGELVVHWSARVTPAH
jgi:ABC-type transporter Mla MlaB component